MSKLPNCMLCEAQTGHDVNCPVAILNELCAQAFPGMDIVELARGALNEAEARTGRRPKLKKRKFKRDYGRRNTP